MRLLNSEMETVTVPESLLYYLLGYVVLEEKRKSGFQLAEHLDEETFRLFLGYTVYNIVLNPKMTEGETDATPPNPTYTVPDVD